MLRLIRALFRRRAYPPSSEHLRRDIGLSHGEYLEKTHTDSFWRTFR